MSVLQFAYGLRITVDDYLPGLPSHLGTQPVDFHIRLKHKRRFIAKSPSSSDQILYVSPMLDPEGRPNLTVARLAENDCIAFFYSDGTRFAITPEGSEASADWPDCYTLEDACTYLLGPVIAYALRLRGVTCLHASAVALDGRAVALFGLAGSGKSTAAAAFALQGFSVLSDDVAVLTEKGRCFEVQPGYPRVNLWPDSVRTLLGSEDALPRITSTWDKRYLALDGNGRHFQASPLPVGAIYLLGDREDGLSAPEIEDVAGGEALMTLVANTYVNYLLDSEMRAHEFGVLSRVLAQVPVRRVRIPADPSKVFALCEAIAADAKQVMPPLASRAAHRTG